MEVPRIFHDEMLHHVEEPQEEQLHQALHGLEPHVKAVEAYDVRLDIDSSHEKPLNEKTPLLMAGKLRVQVDSTVDLKALALKLNAEEHAAVLADSTAQSMDIIKEESKQLVLLALPLMLAVLLEFLPEMILSMLIGHSDPDPVHSTQILAAFTLSNLFQMILVACLLNGLGSAIDTMCSQAYGAKRYREMWLFSQAGFLVYAASIPFIAATLFNGRVILQAMGQDPAIADIASNLLVITFLSLPFSILYSVLKSALQAQNIVAPFTLSSVVSWAISLPLAYYLGFYTSLGYIGIALSNVVNNAVKSLYLIPVIIRNPIFKESWPGFQIREAIGLLPNIGKLAVSSVLMVFFQMAGFSLISLLAGLLPNAAVMIAANSIFASSLALSFMPLLGICIAGAIRIGNSLGAGQARRASLIGRVVMVSSVAVASVGMIVTAFLAAPLAHSFTSDEEAVNEGMKLINRLLPIIPMLGFIFGIQSIFRACGKQWLCAKMNFVFMFVLAIPLGIFFALKLHAGITGLWLGNFAGMLCFILFGVFWLNRVSWDEMAHEARRNTHLHVETKENNDESATPAAAAF